mgnify:FL=1
MVINDVIMSKFDRKQKKRILKVPLQIIIYIWNLHKITWLNFEWKQRGMLMNAKLLYWWKYNDKNGYGIY